ncbi:flavin reductase family protein [Rhodococcus sp. G-MC3]|uniref:flavin reductase family protein n=1 Tax=Rhodococcus sp. G-MC3 TaxID=3046209 RepID=UPI0024BB6DD2|nr:flavin reductase family protein [Rhodococcus sp. G-MC3]MDJ0396400.1 flavin reductase family protein [Rhodococcus sp. G-MC3]
MDPHLFKEAMARVTAPVAIVTANDNGTPHGTTVSSLASLSLTPAMITIALDEASALLGIVRRTGEFGVNVLAADQHDTATRFASRRDDRFADTAWEFTNGVPRIAGSSAWLHCTVTAEIPGGDHTLILGQVHTCSSLDNTPLVYSRRTLGIQAALPMVAAVS